METKLNTFIFILVIFFGFFLRFYNLNFENFWIDETITFWVGNPEFSISQSFKYHKSIEQVPFLFNFLIKLYFKVFGYDFQISRYIPALLSSLSIISVSYINKEISNDKSYIFTSFLIAINIYLISYAQELRLYSTLFFLISLTIYFSFKFENKNKLIFFYLYNIFLLLTSLIHPFGLIIYFAIILSELKFFQKNDKFILKKIITYIFSGLFILIYYFTQLNESYLTPVWIEKIDIKFFTNLFFSNFFGSRVMGLIYLITFLTLTLKFFKSFNKNKKLFFLLSIFLLSYLLPILYSILFRPILIPRYVIFVIIPIIVIISYFVFKLNRLNKNLILTFLILITFLNLTTEQTFKQFYQERVSYKHDFEGALKKISTSEINYYSISIDVEQKKLSKAWEASIENYISFVLKKNNLNLSRVPYSNELENSWVICIHDLNQNKCDKIFKNRLKTVKLNRIDLIKIP